MTEQERKMNYEDVLVEYAKYFEQSDVASNVLRWIGWKLIFMLHTLCDFCQGLWDSVFQVFDFTEQFASRLGDYYEIWYAVLLVAILAVGTMYLLSEKRPPFVRNLVLTAAVVTLLPGGVRTAGQLLQIEKQVYMAGSESVADTTIIVNTVDLLYQKENGWSFSSPNCLSGATIKYVDANETVEKKTAKAFKYYKRVDESTGKVSFKEIKKGFFGLLTPLYYRYSISFMAILAELIVNILVLIFASYRLFRMIWDMVYGELLAYIMSGDVASGEKTKQILKYMLNLFWGISIMIWGFAIWREFQAWVNAQEFVTPIRILLIAFAGIAMVDGPDIVERIMGIDVGMKEGFMKTVGAIHLMQAGVQGAHNLGAKAQKASGVLGKAGSKMVNPGGAMEQNRMSKALAQEPPGGATNPQGESDSKRREPPGASTSKQEETVGVTKAAQASTNEQSSSQKQMNDNVSETQKNSSSSHTAKVATSDAMPESEMRSEENVNRQASVMQEVSATGRQEPSAAMDSEIVSHNKQKPFSKAESRSNAGEKLESMNQKGVEKSAQRQENGETTRKEPETKENSRSDVGNRGTFDKKEPENKNPEKATQKTKNEGGMQSEPPRKSKNENGTGNDKVQQTRKNMANKKNNVADVKNEPPTSASNGVRNSSNFKRQPDTTNGELKGKAEPNDIMGKEPSQMTPRQGNIPKNPSMASFPKENNYSAMPKNVTRNNNGYRESSARTDLSAKEKMREGSRQGNERQEANMQDIYMKDKSTPDKERMKDKHSDNRMALHPTWNGSEPDQK